VDDVEKRKFLILPGLELRPLGRPARSQSLYRLRYSGFLAHDVWSYKMFLKEKHCDISQLLLSPCMQYSNCSSYIRHFYFTRIFCVNIIIMTQFYNAVSVGYLLIILTWGQYVYKLYCRRHEEFLFTDVCNKRCENTYAGNCFLAKISEQGTGRFYQPVGSNVGIG
jgi:hypothetical protein